MRWCTRKKSGQGAPYASRDRCPDQRVVQATSATCGVSQRMRLSRALPPACQPQSGQAYLDGGPDQYGTRVAFREQEPGDQQRNGDRHAPVDRRLGGETHQICARNAAADLVDELVDLVVGARAFHALHSAHARSLDGLTPSPSPAPSKEYIWKTRPSKAAMLRAPIHCLMHHDGVEV